MIQTCQRVTKVSAFSEKRRRPVSGLCCHFSKKAGESSTRSTAT